MNENDEKYECKMKSCIKVGYLKKHVARRLFDHLSMSSQFVEPDGQTAEALVTLEDSFLNEAITNWAKSARKYPG